MPYTMKKRTFHVAEDRLREVITSAIGIYKRDTVLSLEESEHLRDCDDCIERFGNMARQVIRERHSDHEESHDDTEESHDDTNDSFSCPTCGSTEVRPSHRVVKDWAKLLVLRTPFRCRHCYARFWHWIWKSS